MALLLTLKCVTLSTQTLPNVEEVGMIQLHLALTDRGYPAKGCWAAEIAVGNLDALFR